MKLAAILLVLLAPLAARAEIITREIPYEHGGVKLKGYLAYDDAKVKPGAKVPGVLVVHEWWGLNDYPRSRARQLAELGYIAFALDMYGEGVITTDPKRASELAGQFYADPRLFRDRAGAGLKVLLSQENVDRARVAAIGYCFGGSAVLELARSGAPLNAIVSFHGGLDTQAPAQPGQVKARILVCNGADDPMVPPEKVRALQEELRTAGADYVVINFGGAVHGFTNPRADSDGIKGVGYNKLADQRSWEAMKHWLGESFAG
jgi:dienelactone hydrolase